MDVRVCACSVLVTELASGGIVVMGNLRAHQVSGVGRGVYATDARRRRRVPNSPRIRSDEDSNSQDEAAGPKGCEMRLAEISDAVADAFQSVTR